MSYYVKVTVSCFASCKSYIKYFLTNTFFLFCFGLLHSAIFQSFRIFKILVTYWRSCLTAVTRVKYERDLKRKTRAYQIPTISLKGQLTNGDLVTPTLKSVLAIKLISSVPIFYQLFSIIQHWLTNEGQVHIYKVSSQLNCGNICQIYTSFKASRFFPEIRNIKRRN